MVHQVCFSCSQQMQGYRGWTVARPPINGGSIHTPLYASTSNAQIPTWECTHVYRDTWVPAACICAIQLEADQFTLEQCSSQLQYKTT